MVWEPGQARCSGARVCRPAAASAPALRRLSGSGSRSEFHFLLPTRKWKLANGGRRDSSESGSLQALQSAPRARVASLPQAIVSVVDGLA